MLYITTDEFLLKGSYEEPIYDHAPWVGTYSTEKTIIIPVNTGIELDENGKVIFINMDINLGVSMYKGTFTTYENLGPLVGSKLQPIAVDEYNKMVEQEEERQLLMEKRWDAEAKLDILCEQQEMILLDAKNTKHLSREEYERFSHDLLKNALLAVRLTSTIAQVNVALM